MPAPTPLEHWLKGQPATALHLEANVLAQEADRLAIQALATAGMGRHVDAAEQPVPFPVTIHNTGPKGEADLAGSMYWVRQCYFPASSDLTARPTVAEDTANQNTDGNVQPNIFPACDGASIVSDSRSFVAGQLVWCIACEDVPSDETTLPEVRYFIVGGGGESTGEYAEMVRKMVTARQAGFEFTRLHGLLNNS